MGIADSRVAGIKGTGYIATDLHGSDVSNSILDAAEELVLSKGAGAIVLGCAVSTCIRNTSRMHFFCQPSLHAC